MQYIPLERLAQVMGAELGEVVVNFKLALFNGVVRDTRVGNPDGWKNPAPPGYVGGRLRGNWQCSIGRPILQDIERIDPSGAEVEADIRRTVTTDNIDYLMNNLPYAEVWEEHDGMIAKNVARLARIAEEVSK